jgi:hypothetical protein
VCDSSVDDDSRTSTGSHSESRFVASAQMTIASQPSLLARSTSHLNFKSYGLRLWGLILLHLTLVVEVVVVVVVVVVAYHGHF